LPRASNHSPKKRRSNPAEPIYTIKNEVVSTREDDATGKELHDWLMPMFNTYHEYTNKDI